MTDIVSQTSHECILIASGPRKKLKIVFALIYPPINLSAKAWMMSFALAT